MSAEVSEEERRATWDRLTKSAVDIIEKARWPRAGGTGLSFSYEVLRDAVRDALLDAQNETLLRVALGLPDAKELERLRRVETEARILHDSVTGCGECDCYKLSLDKLAAALDASPPEPTTDYGKPWCKICGLNTCECATTFASPPEPAAFSTPEPGNILRPLVLPVQIDTDDLTCILCHHPLDEERGRHPRCEYSVRFLTMSGSATAGLHRRCYERAQEAKIPPEPARGDVRAYSGPDADGTVVDPSNPDGPRIKPDMSTWKGAPEPARGEGEEKA